MDLFEQVLLLVCRCMTAHAHMHRCTTGYALTCSLRIVACAVTVASFLKRPAIFQGKVKVFSEYLEETGITKVFYHNENQF